MHCINTVSYTHLIVSRLIPENIKFETSVCSTSYYIKGQVGALNQIILNLVTNAIHAIGDKKGRIKLQFGLSVDDGQMVRLVVEDNGCGIPKDLRKHVFEPFFTTKKDGKGTGIGLTVVKRMVEEHGGWIQAVSYTHLDVYKRQQQKLLLCLQQKDRCRI